MKSHFRFSRRQFWWWMVGWSLYDTVQVLLAVFYDRVTWITWLFGILAIGMALVAGPYPTKEVKNEL